MRLTVLALASLLFACTQQGENAASNAQAEANAQAPAGGNQSAPSDRQPSNGEARPEPSDEISLEAAPQQVNAGATVQLTLVNGTEQSLGYNLCTSTLQTGGGSEIQTDRVCTMELRMLEPGETTTYPYDLPGVLEDGSYRFTTSVQRMGSGNRSMVTSNSIEVR